MVFGIVGSQITNNAKPLAAEMVGSAFKITHINHRPEHIRQLKCNGFRNSSGSFAKFTAIRLASSWPLIVGEAFTSIT
jgi:hypothetical protein